MDCCPLLSTKDRKNFKIFERNFHFIFLKMENLDAIQYDESILPDYLQQQYKLENLIFNPTNESMIEVLEMIPLLSTTTKDTVARMIIESAEVNRFKFDILVLPFPNLSTRCRFQNTVFSEWLVANNYIYPAQLYDKVYQPNPKANQPFDDESLGYFIINDDLDKLVYSSCNQDFFDIQLTVDCINGTQTKLSLIDLAAQTGAVKSFRYLMINGAKISEHTAQLAVEGGALDIIELCQQMECNFSNCLKQSIHAHKTEITQWILDNYQPSFPDLFFCVSSFNSLAFVYSVKSGADVNQRNDELDTILHYLAYFGQLELTQFLIENNASIDLRDDKDLTAFHLAANQGYIELVKFLAEHGADINAPGQYGKRPIHLAAANGHLEIVKFLVEKGADIEPPQGKWNNSPALLAASGNNIEIVKYLISKGANINTKGSFGNTLFGTAILNESNELLNILFENKADIEITDNYGRTPLIQAAKIGNSRFVTKLLANGAKKDAKDLKGKTALDWAKNDEIIDVLK